MIQPTNSRRRADRGTLIVRASVVALGLAASVGPQTGGRDAQGRAASAGDPSPGMCAQANGSFAFQ